MMYKLSALSSVLGAFLLGTVLLGQPSLAGAKLDNSRLSKSGENGMGLEIVGVQLAAADYMLDFRYRVVEPDLAASLINAKTHHYLLDEATGTKLIVPAPAKVGPLRHMGDKLLKGRRYSTLFANPGKFIKRGSKVTVVIGEHHFKHIVVQ